MLLSHALWSRRDQMFIEISFSIYFFSSVSSEMFGKEFIALLAELQLVPTVQL
jgi:hypothetical protein